MTTKLQASLAWLIFSQFSSTLTKNYQGAEPVTSNTVVSRPYHCAVLLDKDINALDYKVIVYTWLYKSSEDEYNNIQYWFVAIRQLGKWPG